MQIEQLLGDDLEAKHYSVCNLASCFSSRQLLHLFLNLVLFLLLHHTKVKNLYNLWPECLKVFQECEGSNSYYILLIFQITTVQTLSGDPHVVNVQHLVTFGWTCRWIITSYYDTAVKTLMMSLFISDSFSFCNKYISSIGCLTTQTTSEMTLLTPDRQVYLLSPESALLFLSLDCFRHQEQMLSWYKKRHCWH